MALAVPKKRENSRASAPEGTRFGPIAALEHFSPDLLVRNAFLFAPRLRDQAVPEVFPQSTVLLQVDENSDLVPLAIDNEVDTLHVHHRELPLLRGSPFLRAAAYP